MSPRFFRRKRLPGRVMHGRSALCTWGAQFGWEHDVSPAAWIGPRLHPFARDTGSIIPEGFEAYTRVFHPVELDAGESERWSDVAKRNGRIVHSEMQFHQINVPRGHTPTRQRTSHEPRTGTLRQDQRLVLVEHLRRATTTADRCWFAMWEGFGGLGDSVIRERIELPQRRYLLYRGPIDRVLESPDPLLDQSPNLWWPDDRAWCVATEIDFAWTYVGGDDRTIAAIVSDGRLEALPISLGAKADYAADRVNSALNARSLD